MVDKDGNAIVVVHDLRNSPSEEQLLSYTIYKVSPEGEMLWGNEGLSIDGGISYETSAAMKVIQLEDGSYVFAWMPPMVTSLPLRCNAYRTTANSYGMPKMCAS